MCAISRDNPEHTTSVNAIKFFPKVNKSDYVLHIVRFYPFYQSRENDVSIIIDFI